LLFELCLQIKKILLEFGDNMQKFIINFEYFYLNFYLDNKVDDFL